MKIAMIGHKRVPLREGGVEVVAEELSVRMTELGHSVTCYNRRGRHIADREAKPTDTSLKEYKGVRIRWAPTVDVRGIAAFSASVTASFMALFGGYDIFHYHAEGPAIMCWLPKLFGKKVVVTIHGLDHRRKKWGRFAKTVILSGERNAVRFADAVIVLNKDNRRYFQETYGRKTEMIYNGVSLLHRREAAHITELFGIRKDDYILYLGRLVPEKGLECLITAFKESKSGKFLVIAGSGSDSGEYVSELKALAGDDERIRFIGFVQGEVMEELFSNAWIYILPSMIEGMPLSLLEAMSCACCCVTSDIPENTAVTREAGLSFPVGDSTALAAVIDDLHANPDKVASYRDKAVKEVHRFSWEVTVEQTLDLYEKVLKGEYGRGGEKA